MSIRTARSQLEWVKIAVAEIYIYYFAPRGKISSCPDGNEAKCKHRLLLFVAQREKCNYCAFSGDLLRLLGCFHSTRAPAFAILSPANSALGQKCVFVYTRAAIGGSESRWRTLRVYCMCAVLVLIENRNMYMRCVLMNLWVC
jgi:hypothetical protein